METRFIILLAFFLVLVLNGCSAVDEKAKAGTDLDPKSNGMSSSNEETGGFDLVTKPAQVNKENEDKGNKVTTLQESVNSKDDLATKNSKKEVGSKKGDDLATRNSKKELGSREADDLTANNSVKESVSKEADDLITKNSKKELGSNEADNKLENNDDSNEKSRAKKGDNGKGNSNDDLESNKAVSKGGSNVEDSELSSKEGTQGEECDSSNKCMDHNKNFVACLRVPGNDSPDLSLLIQKKVKGPLSVTLSAPEYVQLEKTVVQFQEQENTKVKVSIRKRGTENLIILKTGNGNCSLDFGDLIARNSGEESYNSIKPTYFNFMSRKPIIIVLSLAAVLILASSCMCVSIRWRQFSSSSSKYQRLDMELPVSSARKSESEVDDGWNNSWGDDWDDEEAPKTPSMPVTPNLSSKGLASRRLNKEGWKD